MRYQVFGSVAVVPDEGPARAVTRRRERTVLGVLLAARGEPVAAERLVGEVWGDVPTTSLGALQVAVSRLRSDLEPGRTARGPARHLVSAAGGYALRAEPDAVDAWRFEDAVAEALRCPSTARRLDLLEGAEAQWTGIPYADCEAEVLARERDRLLELRSTALELRAEALVELDRAGEAALLLGPALEDHPYRERLWSILALAQYRLDRQAEALATLRRLRSRLADDLGVDPSAAVQELEQRLLRQDPDLAPAPSAPEPAAAPAPTQPRRDVPAPARLVGRDHELAGLDSLLAGLPGRRSTGFVAVSGEPGIGKSRLVQEVLRLAAERGLRTAEGRAPQADPAPPLWLWLPVVRALAEEARDPALDPLLGDGLAAGVEDRAAGATLRMYDAVVGQLAAAATRSGGLVVVLEDLHWADESSLRLLAHLADQAPAAPLLVVLTRRTSQDDAAEPLVTATAAVARAGCDRVQVTGLDRAAVGALLDGVLGEHDAQLAGLVHEVTAGNPLFVREYARLLASRPDVRRARVEDLPVPDGVREVLRERVDRLPDDVRSLLVRAAALGSTLDPALLAAVVDRSEDDVLDLLDLAVAAGLVTDGDDGHAFAHPLTREALVHELTAARRMRLHARAVTLLEATPELDGDTVLRLAHHALAAAPLGPEHRTAAVTWAARAARVAQSRQAHPEALTLWRHVAALAPEESAAGVEARLGKAGAFLRLARTAAARDEVTAVIALARRRGDWDLVADAATLLTGAGPWSWREHGRKDEELVAVLTEAVEHVDPARRARLAATLLMEHSYGFDRDQVSAWAERASAEARSSGVPEVLHEVLLTRVVAFSGRKRPGDLEQRLADADELLAMRPRGEIEVGALFHQGTARYDLGRVAGADEAMSRCAAAATALRHSGVDIPLAWWRSTRARDRDDPSAAELGRAAIDLQRRTGFIATDEIECLYAVTARGDSATLPHDVLDRARRCGPPTRAAVAWSLVEHDEPVPDFLLEHLIPAHVEDYASLAGACLQLGVLAALGDRERTELLVHQLTPQAGLVVAYGVLDHLGVVDHFLALGLRSLGRDVEALERARAAVAALERLDNAPWLRRARDLVADLEP